MILHTIKQWRQKCLHRILGVEEDERYQKKKKRKQKIYKEHNLNLIEINEEFLNNLDDFLPKKLLEFNIRVE